ncbi:MAG TPA: glycosyltransferase family 2 protein [Bacteroidia bacterium]|nr:glycosyltransferase family 2 protein [Bacteroidia bacterium]
MNKPDVSVVIVSYNVHDFVMDALRTLYRHTDPRVSLEVFVVDNASSDETVTTVRNEFPIVNLIANAQNKGFPAANNQAFERATGRYVFMLNPDAELVDDSVGAMVKFMDENAAYALLAPKLLNSDRSLQRSCWRFPRVYYILLDAFYLHALMPRRTYSEKDWTKPFEAESVSGAAMFFRREVLQTAKGLDENLFWIEDIDFCFRIRKSGLKVLYWPLTSIIHHTGQSAKKNYRVSVSNQIFNKIKYARKHFGFIRAFLVLLISFVHVIYKLLFFGLLSPFKRVYAAKAKAYAWTLLRLFVQPGSFSNKAISNE